MNFTFAAEHQIEYGASDGSSPTFGSAPALGFNGLEPTNLLPSPPMRTIPANITNPAIRTQLEAIGKQIEAKMNQIEQLKVKMKSGKMGADVLSQLKQVSLEIESLDKQWKELVQS